MSLGAYKEKKANSQTLKIEIESLNMKEIKQLDEFYMKLNSFVPI